MLSSDYEILGVGSPILDHIIMVSDEYLSRIPGAKGGMEPVDYDTLLKIIEESGQTPSNVTGGSAANTIKGLAGLGRKCAFVGKIGNDEAGKKFLKTMESLGIVSFLIPSALPTAQVVCLISPDSERTLRAYLGAGKDWKAEDLNPEIFHGAKLVHIEGYTLLYESLTQTAMEMAKKADAKISFDLSSFEIAQQHKKTIISLVANYVDVLFANEAETQAITQLDSEKGCDVLKDLCDVAVVMMGKEGCRVASGGEKIYQPSLPVKSLDTTGAGDLFASGFLHGYLAQKPLAECARYGTLTASTVVQVVGAEVSQEAWEQIKRQL
jgi:sugar/nucleoside kinase (ribokinase family)